MSFIKKIFSIILSISLININLCFSEILPSTLLKSSSLSSEYFVGLGLGKPLIQINLISGVQKPGVYHIPLDTNLGQLIAYAGGKNIKSNFNQINIYRKNSNKISSFQVDFEGLLEDSRELPELQENDIVYINESRATLERTSQWVSIFAGVLSIALSAALINQSK